MLLLAGTFFVLFFGCWIVGRELFRDEGLFATCALEFIPGNPMTAHGVIQREVPPLFPALASVLNHLGVPMEWALRLLAIFMLGAWSLLAGFAAAKRRNFRAGVVAFFCCSGTIFAMDKGVDGLPTTTAAFFLLAGQLLFFHYGNRLANWNKAWIGASLLWITAYLAGGSIVILYIIGPLLFLRRPMSVSSKFNTPGFFIACILAALILCIRVFHNGYNMQMDFLPDNFLLGEYFERLLLFPLKFPVRLFPWTLLIWLPFCAALQTVDQTPVFSKYLRTMFAVSFAVSWLLPDRPGRELFFAVGPLAIMTGLNYDLGIRRYWKWFRKALFAGEIFIGLVIVAIAGILFLPEKFLSCLPDFDVTKFTYSSGYQVLIVAAMMITVLQQVFFHLQRRQAPIWALILRVSIVCAIFCNVMLLPNYVSEKKWNKLGKDIYNALPENEKIDVLYKFDIHGMYCGLFYAGVPVQKIKSLDELPQNKTIYLISSGFPRHFGWRWAPLLPPEYSFEGVHLTMWRGTPAPEEINDADGEHLK